MQYEKSANGVKALLRANGYNTKNIRVRIERYSGGSSVNVELHTYEYSAEAIKSLVSSQFEKIHRCEASGEILSGGNCFVFVTYKWDMDVSQHVPFVQNAYASFDWRDDNHRTYHTAETLIRDYNEYKHLSGWDARQLVMATKVIPSQYT